MGSDGAVAVKRVWLFWQAPRTSVSAISRLDAGFFMAHVLFALQSGARGPFASPVKVGSLKLQSLDQASEDFEHQAKQAHLMVLPVLLV